MRTSVKKAECQGHCGKVLEGTATASNRRVQRIAVERLHEKLRAEQWKQQFPGGGFYCPECFQWMWSPPVGEELI